MSNALRRVGSALGIEVPTAPKRAGGPAHAPRVPFVLLVVGLIVGGLALLLMLNTASAANELRRHGLAAQDESIAARVQELNNDVAASAAPANLARAAAALGMVPANAPAFLVVGPDGTVRVLGRPGPATAAPLAVPKTKKPKPAKKAKAHPSKSPSTSAGRSAAKSAGKSPSGAKSAHGTTAAAKKSPAKKSSATTSSPKPPPTPSPTPTPTVTLPGGNR